MEEIRENIITECLQKTTQMIAESEEKQSAQIQNLTKSLEVYKTEFTNSTMQIIDMLSTMRREQQDNHISYLKETKSLRDSAHMSTPTDKDSLVSIQNQLSHIPLQMITIHKMKKREWSKLPITTYPHLPKKRL